MFEVIIDEEINKYIENLPKEMSERITDKLKQAKENPFRYFKKLVQRNEFSLRVGKFRVLAEIDIKNKIIFVLDIGNRENIYN